MSAHLDPSARPGGSVLARARHPVAVAAEDPGARSSRLRRCVALAEESLTNIRALRDFLAPQENGARVRDQLAG